VATANPNFLVPIQIQKIGFKPSKMLSPTLHAIAQNKESEGLRIVGVTLLMWVIPNTVQAGNITRLHSIFTL